MARTTLNSIKVLDDPSKAGAKRHASPAASTPQLLLLCTLVCCLAALGGAGANAQDDKPKSVFDTVIQRNRGPQNTAPEGAKPSESAKATGPSNAESAGTSGTKATSRLPAATPAAAESAAATTTPKSENASDGWAAVPSAPSIPTIPTTPIDQEGDDTPATGAGDVEANNGAATASATVEKAVVVVDGQKTRIRLSLSSGVRAEIFTLANPYRVVIDLPHVTFQVPDGTGRKGAGLISAFRYGLFAEHKGRLVLDATGPVRIDGAKMNTTGKGPAAQLEVDLSAISATEFGEGTGAGAPPPASKPAIFDDPLAKSPTAPAKPLVLIDPGHGGIDPGAIGQDNIMEKSIVFGVAGKLKKALEEGGRYRIAMTRSRDVYVSLGQRLKMSRELGAELFISLHADSLASKEYAAVVRGATVYTLSEKASDEQARRMAENENAADLVAGLDTHALESENDQVRGILIDLMKRETTNFSTDFSNMLVANLKHSVSLSKEPQRSAAFKVLKQTHAPSVLVELGYMSNPVDAEMMHKPEWQTRVAKSIATSIDAFFDKRTARWRP